jgi:Domain of unknown function (DU1801)
LGNPQKIKFRNVGDFLDGLPENELVIIEILRELILESIPNCKEKLAYNVPFYYRHSRVVFIWPASVPWGSVKNGVALGFCKGTRLFDLDTTDKKSVGRKVFTSAKGIDTNEIRQLLYEAVLLDEQDHKQKKKK